MNTDMKPGMKIGGTEVKRSCHACAFFHSRDEYYEVLLPFIKEGILEGDKSVHIVDESNHADHRSRLKDHGIDVHEAEKAGRFELCNWQDSYLKPGHFSQDAMLEFVEGLAKEVKEKGYPGARIVGCMEWACQHDTPGVKDLVKYETRLTNVLNQYDGVVVCTYDLSKHSASVVMDVLRSHPYVLIGGLMHENPYYTQPGELLAELERRDA